MSSIKKNAAIYAIGVGMSMIIWWGILLATGEIPEMATTPYTAWLHITAELSTGLALVASGAGLLWDRRWAKNVFLVAVGMLFYAVIQASGYFAQAGQLALTLMFVVFLLLGLFFLSHSSRLESASS